MRSTLSFEPEVHRLVLKAMRDNQASFKATVNDAIRRGLSSTKPQNTPFVVKSSSMGLMNGFDPNGMNRLLDDLFVEDALEKLARSARTAEANQ
jgi:hypothetical protein